MALVVIQGQLELDRKHMSHLDFRFSSPVPCHAIHSLSLFVNFGEWGEVSYMVCCIDRLDDLFAEITRLRSQSVNMDCHIVE
ncbi:hypothetical protein J6590_025057 [Homalodisca vitripennis]|nr:hypothetical protein J6590_025057 [Homalodisca vitripennis]